MSVGLGTSIGLGLGLVLGLGVSVRVRIRVRVKVRVMVRVRDAWGTKRLGTKRLRYEMSGSRKHTGKRQRTTGLARS